MVSIPFNDDDQQDACKRPLWLTNNGQIILQLLGRIACQLLEAPGGGRSDADDGD